MRAMFGSAGKLLRGAAIASALLCSAASDSARAQGGRSQPPPKEPKNYAIPWVFTIVGMMMIALPLTLPARRKWEVPSEVETEE